MEIITDLVARVQQEILNRYSEAIPEFQVNGHIQRFDKCATWLVGNSWEFKGKTYCSVQYGNWKIADGTHRVDSFEKKQLSNKSFLKNFTVEMDSINERVKREKQEKHDKCKKKWLPIWKSSDKEKLHDYLIDKGLEETYGSRVDSNGVMLSALYNTNGFTGVQRIFRNPDTDLYEKRFAAGVEIKGSICPLMPFKDSHLVYVSEGFATACTVQKAFPKVPSICVFNSGNILPAIQTIRKVNPSCKIIICADRDSESNTGEKFARFACRKTNSCIYKMPKFNNDNPRWSDFNDLHQFGSLKEVQDQLKFVPSDFVVIQALGVKDVNFYYMSSENPQPIRVMGHNHTERYLYTLVPDPSWWKKNYPKFDKEDENREFPIGIDWTRAGTDLMDNCLKKGQFEFSNVRSSGVWEDNGTYYYHNGFKLYNGIKNVDIFSDELTKHYVMGKSCHDLERKNQLTERDRGNLLEIFSTISTKTQQQGLLLLGWLVSAPIAGALPWRPHIWLTGESSQGKSWTMENVMGEILRGFCLRPQGDSSEAGIRQSVGNQALPLVFDEFETDDTRTSARTEGVISLARQSSTPTEGDIMRGTTTGSSMTFSPNFSLCVSSINVNLSHKQDKNRWTVIEFSSDRASEEQFEKVQKIVKETINFDFGQKMVSYAFHNIKVYNSNFDTIDRYLRKKGHKGHFCRQYASLLAGLMLMIRPEAIEESDLETYLGEFDFAHFLEQTGEDDPEIFRESLLSSIVKVDNDNLTLSEIINLATQVRNCPYQKTLMRYGIKSGIGCFYIKRTSNKNFQALFSDSKWKNNWAIALMRIKGTDKNDNKSVWIGGKSVKVIKVPFQKWELQGED